MERNLYVTRTTATSPQKISVKNSERKSKITMKKFLKNLSFGVDFKLPVPPLMYAINADILSGVNS